MSISNIEQIQIFEDTGVGKMPLTGGPSTNLKSPIAQTLPFECAVSVITPSTGVMNVTSIYLTAGQTISNINFVSGSTAEGTGTHLLFCLYDDGRSSTTVNQLALLGQTADQTGAAALAANTNLGLALITPYITTYSGIYYVGFICAATTMPTLAGITRGSTASITVASATGAFYSGTAGSSLTNQAPNPSGTVTVSAATIYAYVS